MLAQNSCSKVLHTVDFCVFTMKLWRYCGMVLIVEWLYGGFYCSYLFKKFQILVCWKHLETQNRVKVHVVIQTQVMLGVQNRHLIASGLQQQYHQTEAVIAL